MDSNDIPEILYNIRHAVCPYRQAHIEAELHNVPFSTIQRICSDHGVAIKSPKPLPKHVHILHDYAQAEQLYRAGASDREISSATGINFGTIVSWRERHQWAPNKRKRVHT